MELGLRLRLVEWCVVLIHVYGHGHGLPVDAVLTDDTSYLPIEFPAFCTLTEGTHLRRYDGTTREMPIVSGESIMNLCSKPSDFHVTVTISGSFNESSAKMFLTVKDGTRVVKATIPQHGNFEYQAYNIGSYDCLSMAGVQTVVRNFGQSLVIETGFASIIANRNLKLESFLVQNPRHSLCGSCGRVEDMSRICALSSSEAVDPSDQKDNTNSPPEASQTEPPHHPVHSANDVNVESGP